MKYRVPWRRLVEMVILTLFTLSNPSCINHHAVGRYAAQPIPAAVRIDRLVVRKSDQWMDAYAGDVLLKSYRVQTGYADGAKRWEGDRRTPEGEYRITARFPSKRFSRFLHVSYPNVADLAQYRQLKREGAVPKGAGVGSAIGVHGESDEASGKLAAALGINWTAGCIAVTNKEIAELYRAVAPQARIIIVP